MFSHIPLRPSELYLAAVLERKKPRGPLLELVRAHRGRPTVVYAANYLKFARRAMAMAYYEALKEGAVLPTNNRLRNLAAGVLEKMAQVLPGHYAPARFVYSTAEYKEALVGYRHHFKPLRTEWNKLP